MIAQGNALGIKAIDDVALQGQKTFYWSETCVMING